MVCTDVFLWLKQDTFRCSFMFILCCKEERLSFHVPLELRRYSDLSQHIKEPHIKCYLLFQFLTKKKTKIESRLYFIPKVTCSVFSVRTFSMSCLLRDLFFTAWRESAIVGHSNSNEVGGGSLQKVNSRSFKNCCSSVKTMYF